MADDKDEDKPRPILIIKKVKKGGHGHHHGGAWKVAYADFVTAMMAFFMLMWLLNAASEEQKRGITQFFSPAGTAVGGSGTGGILGGMSAFIKGSLESITNPPPSVGPLVGQTSTPDSDARFDKIPDHDLDTTGLNHDGDEGQTPQGATRTPRRDMPGLSNVFPDASRQSTGAEAPPGRAAPSMSAQEHTKDMTAEEAARHEAQRKQAEQAQKKAQKEAAAFTAVQKELKDVIKSVPRIKGLEKNLIMEESVEGLRIQIVDQDNFAMFPSGKADMYPHAKQLLTKLAEVIKKLPNTISITGHTDAIPFAASGSYSNWELSTDRANASRRVLLEAGFPPEKIGVITGRASSEPLIKEDPYAPKNRRISIVLLRKNPLQPPGG